MLRLYSDHMRLDVRVEDGMVDVEPWGDVGMTVNPDYYYFHEFDRWDGDKIPLDTVVNNMLMCMGEREVKPFEALAAVLEGYIIDLHARWFIDEAVKGEEVWRWEYR